ncbi:MAG TPA: TatD family hydrolase [Candidatus Saccharimonadales bacterium]|nr:TatD family hydrolase [Candidatus Saccharimonadales bacterium]
MMELTDTHCHIQSAGRAAGERGTRQLWSKSPELTADRLVAEAAAAGVTRLICVGCDLDDSRLAAEFAESQDNCWASAGIHPHEAQRFAGQTAKLAEFARLPGQPKVVAVGECGLDYHYQHSPPAAQREILRFQIELAVKYQLPLIFHVRDAFDDFWPVFDSYQGLSGVLHSFTDTAINAQKALERGLYLGVNGITTFTKDSDQVAVYKSIPLDRLLLETDAPFLTPTPYRGSINEPKRVGTIAEWVANVRGDSRDVLARATTSNARQLFGI